MVCAKVDMWFIEIGPHIQNFSDDLKSEMGYIFCAKLQNENFHHHVLGMFYICSYIQILDFKVIVELNMFFIFARNLYLGSLCQRRHVF